MCIRNVLTSILFIDWLQNCSKFRSRDIFPDNTFINNSLRISFLNKSISYSITELHKPSALLVVRAFLRYLETAKIIRQSHFGSNRIWNIYVVSCSVNLGYSKKMPFENYPPTVKFDFLLLFFGFHSLFGRWKSSMMILLRRGNAVVSRSSPHRSTTTIKTILVVLVAWADPGSFPLRLCLIQENLLVLFWLCFVHEYLLHLSPISEGRRSPYCHSGTRRVWSSAFPSRGPLPDLHSTST